MADDDSEAPAEAHDVVLLHGPTDDGQGLRGLRSRPGRLELTEIRPVREGQPLGMTELVRLHRRKQNPMVCDVDVVFDPREPEKTAPAAPSRPTHSGPAQVASPRYRQNYDTIFRPPRGKPDKKAPN